MDLGEDSTLLAVALDGEDKYWLCQPVTGKRLGPEWKFCTCYWLYLLGDNEDHGDKPWYREDLGDILEIGYNETSRIGRYSVIDDAVKAKKFVVEEGGVSRTFFFIGNDEREALDAKFEDLLKREAALASHKPDDDGDKVQSSVKASKATAAEYPTVNSDSGPGNGKQVGNEEVFAWRERYIVEHGNRIFFVCPDVDGNSSGFRVERIVRNGMTIFLLFHDEASLPCRVSESHIGEKVIHTSIMKNSEGKVLIMSTRKPNEPMSKKKERVETPPPEPPLKVQKKESVKTTASHDTPLKAIGVNMWVDFKGKVEGVTGLVNSFPFSGEVGNKMRTSVFPGGVCVTYDSSIAAKFALKKKAVSSPTDNDMVGLLENIQLAKEQFSTI
ncbi:uncharacterized protein TEOVI_000714000 [Trypanosoma equiperdum]|uniref:Uncharacterized protein n=3 Tax=Trypanozoon TaxID=39700 RepID=Q382F5_TRYB2|nr:hypothetical protein, conserved [Trypanosoma brucei brucei TREU927]EAN80326.1 hypothetical protein, conserved [Trypanosoma brucei brucei TREU927]SCU66253.1 hypothetical protein, conserved [Trypanosoma equiperdum]